MRCPWHQGWLFHWQLVECLHNAAFFRHLSLKLFKHQGTPHGKDPPRPDAGFLLALQSTHALALDKTTGHPIVTITGLISEKTAVRMRNLTAAMLDKLPQVKMTVPTRGTKKSRL
jgi:hypothetical protein